MTLRELEAWTHAHMRGRAIAGFGGQPPQLRGGCLCYSVNAPGWVAAVELGRPL